MDVPVHCSDGEGRGLRLRGSIYRTGYSISLFYPASPSDIRLAGLDSTDGVDIASNVVAGPHVQLWYLDGERVDYHYRIGTCDVDRIPKARGRADLALIEFARVLNIELKYAIQTAMHLA
jgi:hypothetical protein